ncbi:related to FAD dependent oxidoreductase [Cephalotrichum gorgonifer]|uniref:Related to FAD dependent oxidoreductase n=1 Tax=Cephalotrichum gorgonifer TaxID=2041049 RepID=A0AAE8SX20_9PEZI|nr:related to FAD dependent oxidoreductase [Cephalotrichum gorgonifer]
MLPHPSPTPSYWTRSPISLQSSPPDFTQTPIVILGTGLTAVSVAYSLLPLTSAPVLVLDARSPCDGATGRNGGHCKVVPHEELSKLTPRFGAQRAAELVRFQMRHLASLREVCELVDAEAAGEKTEFREVETVDLYIDKEVFRDAKGNVETMRGVMPDVEVKVWEADEAREHFGANSRCHGAISYKAGALYPYRLVTGLWKYLLKRYPSRLAIIAHAPATSISVSPSPSAPFLIHTPSRTYSARHIIHATNAYASHLISSLRDRIVPVRAHMTSQRPGSLFPSLTSPGLRSWSVIYGQGFEYVTQRPSPDGKGDLLVGGGWARSPSGGADAIDVSADNDVEPFTARYLEGALRDLFAPKWGEGGGVELTWSGIIGVTPDSLPFVGRLGASATARVVPSSVTGTGAGRSVGKAGSGPAEWISAGYNGEGMVFAFLSGTALAAHVAGRESEEMPREPGMPAGKVSDWFPPELYISEERLSGDGVRRDPEGLFSCPPRGTSV